MSIRVEKEKLIEEIQKLRALISAICYKITYRLIAGELIPKVDLESKEKAQKKLNEIHDMIFNI